MHNFIEAFLLCACLLQWCWVVLPVSTSAKVMDICKDSTVGVLNVGDNGTIEIGETSIYKDTPNPCVLKLKSCSYCQIEIRPTKDNRFHFFCGTNNISPNYCSLGCDYLYMFDMYYMNDTLTFYKLNDFKFVSQSSQVFIVLCHGYSENYRIAMNYTVIKKQEKIEGNSAGYRSVGTIKSPFFPSGYAQNHETYEYQFTSSNRDDYIHLQFDDWNLADSSALLFEDSNIASLVNGHSSRPVVVSNGNAMRVVFHTGQTVGADQERTYIGFKATYRFISDRQTISSPKTDCPGSGYLLDSTGGEITVRATSQAHQFFDCIWVVKKQPFFDGVYIKLVTMQLRALSYNTGVNQIQIRSGLTSEGRLIATLKTGTDVHRVPYDDRTGFYIRLNSSLSSTDEVVLSYSSYKDAYTSCSWNSDLFGCTNGRCIDKSLVCNGYDHCGDNSDEMQGCKATEDWDSSHKYTITIGVIIPMVISVFLIMVICVVFILVRRCRATRLQETAQAEDRLQTLSEEVAGRGGRRRRRRNRPRWFPGNHGSRDNPPTYDEAIQNPPGWYLNVAFGNPADPSLPQPPSYSEAVGGPHDVTRPSGAERPGSPSSSDSSSQSELTIHSRHPSISSLSSEGDSAWASVQTEGSGRTGRCGRHDSSSDSDSDGHNHHDTVATPEPSTTVTSNTTETSNTNLEDGNGVKKLSKVMNENTDGKDEIKKVGSEEDTMVIPDGPKVTFDRNSSIGRGFRALGAGPGPGSVDRVPANHGHNASVLSVSSTSSSLTTPPGRPRPKPRKSQLKNQRKSSPKYEVPEGNVSQRVTGGGATDHVPAAGSAAVCPGVTDGEAVMDPQLQQQQDGIADDSKRSPDDCVLVMSDLTRGDAHPTRRDRNSSGGPPLVRPTVVGAHGDSRNMSVSDSLKRKVIDKPGPGSQPASPHKDHATWNRDTSDQPMVGRRSYQALNTATRDDDNITDGPTDPSLNSPQSGGQDPTMTSCYPTVDPTSNENATYLDASVISGHTSLASVAGADSSPENPNIYWLGEDTEDVYV